MKLITINH